ncbi:diaminopimelate epimerase [Chloroflexota bacterium]
MKFTKLQSAGNDFVLIEGKYAERNMQQLAKDACQRHFGIGADGLLVLLPSEKANISMRVFNADGSEAEACGNGLRCLVKYASDNGFVAANVDDLRVETIAGIRKARLLERSGNSRVIQSGMGKPEFSAAKIPVNAEASKGKLIDIMFSDYPLSIDSKELRLNFVAMGNPHAIYFQQQPVSGFPLSQIGPLVENNEIFPRRINFEIASVLDRKQIEARVWERGVGETLACGSGACAMAVAAQILGYTDSPVEIKLPGGVLKVEWDMAGEVLLSGIAETVFSGEWLTD